MARVQIAIDEVEQMESLIRTGSSDDREGYDVGYSQLGRGSFDGMFVGTRWDVDWVAELAPEAEINDAELYTDSALEYLSIQRYGPRLRIRGASPSDRCAFYVLSPATSLVRHRGTEVAPASLIVVPPGSEMDFLVEDLEMATFSFHQRAVESIWRGAERSITAEALPLPALGPLLFELARSILAGDENRLADPQATRRFEETFSSAVAGARPAVQRTRRATTRQGLKRVETALHQNLTRTLPSRVLAEIAQLPLRTLQHAFREEFGVSPQRYHALLRMRSARRHLLEHRADNSTVAAAATLHGFEHLGRFSVAYRQLFGETPSATLKRRSGRRARRVAAASHAEKTASR